MKAQKYCQDQMNVLHRFRVSGGNTQIFHLLKWCSSYLLFNITLMNLLQILSEMLDWFCHICLPSTTNPRAVFTHLPLTFWFFYSDCLLSSIWIFAITMLRLLFFNLNSLFRIFVLYPNETFRGNVWKWIKKGAVKRIMMQFTHIACLFIDLYCLFLKHV